MHQDLLPFLVMPNPQETAGLAPGRPVGRGSSYWFSFMLCPQLHAHKYVLKVLGSSAEEGAEATGPARWGSDAQNFGSCVHQAQANAWLRVQWHQQGRNPNEWLDPYEAVRVATEKGLLGPLEQADKDRLGFVLDTSLPASLDGQHTVLAVEQPLRWEFGVLNLPGHPEHGQPLVYTPRLDLVLADAASQVYITDHKTTSAGKGAATARSYALHGQFLAARAAGRQMYGPRYGGVLLNLISTRSPFGGGMKPLEAAPAAERRLQGRLIEAAHYKAELERATMLGQLDPWSWPAALSEQVCCGKYGFCEGFELCQWGPR